MRLINTKVHGIYDYLMGLLLFMSPTIFDFSNGELSQNICRAIGVSMWVAAIMSNYEFGFVKILSLKKHLFLDLCIGSLLAFSPWLCDFHEIVYKPHLVFGLSIIAVSFFSDRVRSTELSAMLNNQKKQKTKDKRAENHVIASFPSVKFVVESSEFVAFKALDKNGVLKKVVDTKL